MKKSVILSLVFLHLVLLSRTEKCKTNKDCGNGYCKEEKCICNQDWWGNMCEFCRVRLIETKGIISDGGGPHKVNSKLMWLIDPGGPNKVINLVVEQFSTECSWDHLYIYDGDSIDAPLLATLSGLIKDYSVKETANEPVLEITATSGTAYLYFYSDANYFMNGFNISYSIVDSCPNHCSGRGFCNNSGNCVCKNGWTGSDCSQTTYLKPCINGTYNAQTRLCVCDEGFSGTDCSLKAGISHWEHHIPVDQALNEGRSKHVSSILGDWMWIFGGYALNVSQISPLVRYNIITNKWVTVTPLSGPSPSSRYGHSMITYKDCLYVFGGEVNGNSVNELWVFNTTDTTWKEIHPTGSKLAAVSLHTADLVDDKMIILLGRSSVYVYVDWVQEYHFDKNTWHLVEPSGPDKMAAVGHSSAYDPYSQLIYVHGGYVPYLQKSGHDILSSHLHAYNPHSKTWLTLTESGRPVYLHTAVFHGHLMYIFGGNRHNDTSDKRTNAKCFTDVLSVYDSICDRWYTLDKLPGLPYGLSRYGHTAHMVNGMMYVFGGFNGRLFSDILKLSLGNCSQYITSDTCLSQFSKSGCVWTTSENKCLSPLQAPLKQKTDLAWPTCPDCTNKKSCSSCVKVGCQWCGSSCKKTCDNPFSATKLSQCPKLNFCSNVVSCEICDETPECHFDKSPFKCINTTNKGHSSTTSLSKCPKNCHTKTSCSDCIGKTMCMWCESTQRCVEFSSYVTSFPFGQCLEWTSNKEKCPDAKCNERKTCRDCHSLPGCGWCDDGSGSGLGNCMEGGNEGPVTRSASQNTTGHCPTANWFFMKCPLCQCNGHSTCYNGVNCSPCRDKTTGPHCENCAEGLYGDARNGGTCKPCQCNKQAKTCDARTGKCNCLDNGVTGDHCERCSTNYRGNSTNGGFCYHGLVSEYEYNFNITEKNSINFYYMPTRPDNNIEFKLKVKSGGPIKVNITTITDDMNYEKKILNKVKVFEMQEAFSFEEYDFGGPNNRRFFVYLSDFKGLIFEISFVQQPEPINLLHFFITFFGGFFSLLFIATIFWKVKRRYDAYVHYRRRHVEMAQMASRPFGQSIALLTTDPVPVGKIPVTVVAVEPCRGNHAAVQTVLMKLPNTCYGVTPIGQSGLCLASTLVTYGNSHNNRDEATHANKRGVSKQQSSHITGCL